MRPVVWVVAGVEPAQEGASADDGAVASVEASAPAGPEPQALLVGGLVLASLGAALLPLADAALVRAGGAFAAPGAGSWVRWRLGHVLQAAALGLGASLVAAFVAAALGLGFVALLAASQLLMVATSAIALAFARRLHADGPDALGLRTRGLANATLGGVLAYALAAPALFGVMLAWPGLARLVGIEVDMQDVAEGILAQEGAALVAVAFLAVGVAPLFEEIVFRGFLQPYLVQMLGVVGGISATSLVFALLHADAFLPIFALAHVLGWIRWRTRSTLACAAVHALHNGGTLTLLLLGLLASKAAPS